MSAAEYAHRAFGGLYVALWLVRLARAGVRPGVAVPVLAVMTWSFFSHSRVSVYVFMASILAAHLSMRGGGGRTGRRIAGAWDSLTDVVRSSFRRDVSASS